MRVRPLRIPLAVAQVPAGCGPDQADRPAAVRLTEVALPGGGQPLVLTPVGDSLLDLWRFAGTLCVAAGGRLWQADVQGSCRRRTGCSACADDGPDSFPARPGSVRHDHSDNRPQPRTVGGVGAR